jgi:DNA-binding GntR family transcriptional regulator
MLGRRMGRAVARVPSETEIVAASPDVARILGVTPGVLMLANVATDYLADGLAVHAAEMHYRVDRVRFSFVGDFPSSTVEDPRC